MVLKDARPGGEEGELGDPFQSPESGRQHADPSSTYLSPTRCVRHRAHDRRLSGQPYSCHHRREAQIDLTVNSLSQHRTRGGRGIET